MSLKSIFAVAALAFSLLFAAAAPAAEVDFVIFANPSPTTPSDALEVDLAVELGHNVVENDDGTYTADLNWQVTEEVAQGLIGSGVTQLTLEITAIDDGLTLMLDDQTMSAVGDTAVIDLFADDDDPNTGGGNGTGGGGDDDDNSGSSKYRANLVQGNGTDIAELVGEVFRFSFVVSAGEFGSQEYTVIYTLGEEIPEPASLALMGIGGLVILGGRRRNR